MSTEMRGMNERTETRLNSLSLQDELRLSVQVWRQERHQTLLRTEFMVRGLKQWSPNPRAQGLFPSLFSTRISVIYSSPKMTIQAGRRCCGQEKGVRWGAQMASISVAPVVIKGYIYIHICMHKYIHACTYVYLVINTHNTKWLSDICGTLPLCLNHRSLETDLSRN